MICEDSGLGYTRTKGLVIVQILQQGRDTATKRKAFLALAKALDTQCGLNGEDLVISCAGNGREDWSFGHGEAQFLAGLL